MGDVLVPIAAKWRAQTQRAVENFPVSGQRVEPALVHALAAIKRSAAAQSTPSSACCRTTSRRRSPPSP